MNTGSGDTKLSAGGVYSGTGTGTLTISGVTLPMSGAQFKAYFTNAAGTIQSNPATLTVQDPAVVTLNPASQSVLLGGTATFTATASGTAVGVQWNVSTDGGVTYTAIPGATSTTYSFQPVADDVGNIYRASFSNLVSTGVTTSPATLSSVESWSVAAGQSVLGLNPNENTYYKAASFTISGADVGDTLAYTVISSGGGTPVSKAGIAITATSQQVQNIDLSTLLSGTVTYQVTLTKTVAQATCRAPSPPRPRFTRRIPRATPPRSTPSRTTSPAP